MQATDQAFFEAYKRLGQALFRCLFLPERRNGIYRRNESLFSARAASCAGVGAGPFHAQGAPSSAKPHGARARYRRGMHRGRCCRSGGFSCAHPLRERPACAPEPDGSSGEKTAQSADAGERVPRFRETEKIGAEHMDRHCDHRRGDLSDCTDSDNFPLNSEKVILLQKAKIGCAVLSGQAHPIFMPDGAIR